MNRKKFDYKHAKEVFIQNIDDSYTCELAMSLLIDNQSLTIDNLILSQTNTDLKQALNKIRNKIINIPNYKGLHYFDDILQIIYETIGDDDSE